MDCFSPASRLINDRGIMDSYSFLSSAETILNIAIRLLEHFLDWLGEANADHNRDLKNCIRVINSGELEDLELYMRVFSRLICEFQKAKNEGYIARAAMCLTADQEILNWLVLSIAKIQPEFLLVGLQDMETVLVPIRPDQGYLFVVG
jgi:hypothetical protein